MDPGEIYAKKGLDQIQSLIKRCHILFLTEREVRMLTDSDLFDGTKSLMRIGPSVLVCKKGNQGSHVFTKEGDFALPAIEAGVVDNTGAGDVYNAGFLAGLLLGKSLEKSALFATTVASKSVTGYGRNQYPTREDLEAFFHLQG
jgi:ribokinase